MSDVRDWFEMVTWRDAKLLKRWWNNHGPVGVSFHILPSRENRRFFRVVRVQ